VTYIACQNCLKIIDKLVCEKTGGISSFSTAAAIDTDVLKTKKFTEILELKSIAFGERKTFAEEWV
jgi:hypothetical protein